MGDSDWLGQPHVLYEPQEKECELARGLQAECLLRIDQIGQQQAGVMLGLAPSGVERLCWEPRWSIQTSIRAAEALKVRLLDLIMNTLPEDVVA